VRHRSTLGVQPPGRGAGEIERVRFVRDLSVRSFIFSGPIMVALFILFGVPLWGFLVLCVAFLFQALSILRLTQRIRRVQRVD
jgi:hypothetical protein